MLTRLLTVSALAFAGTFGAAHAATVTGSGVSGLLVDGVTYNVTFQDGTCTDLFDGCDGAGDFPFSPGVDTSNAATALRDAIAASALVNTPNAFNGCDVAQSGNDLCTILTFNDFDAFGSRDAFGVDVWGATSPNVFLGAAPRGFNFFFSDDVHVSSDVTIAVWDRVAAVPLPGAAGLLLASLGILAAGARRRRAQIGRGRGWQACCLPQAALGRGSDKELADAHLFRPDHAPRQGRRDSAWRRVRSAHA